MANHHPIHRRHFVKLCVGAGAVVAANPALLARPAGRLETAGRVRLVHPDGKTLRSDDLAIGENYVFHYPYVTTPCFLFDLGAPADPGEALKTADGQSYQWLGGTGPRRSVVAFSAICAHKMSYPTKDVSFISYRHRATTTGAKPRAREQVIYCCSEGSVYDPRDGGRVLDGPAPQPLAAVQLDYDDDEHAFHATGIYGGDMIERFFDAFAYQLALQNKTDDIRRPATETAVVWPLDEYSNTEVC